MGEVRRLYLDTNILIHVFEHNDQLARELNAFLITGGNEREPFRVTSELTVGELVVEPFRSKDDRLLRLYNNWTQTNPYLEVLPVEYSNLWNAGVLRARYNALKLPDAIHIATAIRARCSHILTADKRLSGTYELDYSWDGHTIGPFAIDVLRPDASTIQSMSSQLSP